MYELLFDTKHYVHGVYLVGKGGINTCEADPFEIFKAALVTTSPAFALVHNHPSGLAEPSREDVALSQRIACGADLLGLDFLDNIVIADGRVLFFPGRRLNPTAG